MALGVVPTETWLDAVKRQTVVLSPGLAAYVDRLALTPSGMPFDDIDARSHAGDLTVNGDFRPESIITAVHGNLTVDGLVSTQGGEDADGNATLIVFGDVRCKTLINEWGSLIVVTGNLLVEDWVYAAREDSALVVGKDFRTPIFIGADIGMTIGGEIEAECAYGYATGLPEPGQTYGTSKALENRSWREIAVRLGLGREVAAEEDLMQALDMQVITTGSVLPR